MSKNPFMKFYPGDYLRATPDLTTEQHGAYMLLLMALWERDGELPNDRATLTRITRIHPPHFNRLWKSLEQFFIVEDGMLRQQRVSRDLLHMSKTPGLGQGQEAEKSEQFLRARAPSCQNPESRTEEGDPTGHPSSVARARGRPMRGRRAPRPPKEQPIVGRVTTLEEIQAEIAAERAAKNGRLDS